MYTMIRASALIAAFVVILCATTAQSAEPPAALNAALTGRANLKKLDVLWSRADYGRSASGGARKYKRTISAGRDIAYFNFGAEDGATHWSEDGTTVTEPDTSLFKDGAFWTKFERSFAADYWPAAEGTPRTADLRSLGLLPMPNLQLSASDLIGRFAELHGDGAAFRESTENGVHIVEAVGPANTVRWVFDASVGGNATHCQAIGPDGLICESETTYRQYDGNWFPESVTYRNGKSETVTEIRIEEAAINSDDIPDELSPEVIGLGSGMAVIPQSGPLSGRNMMYVANGEFCSGEDWDELARKGVVRECDALVQAAAARKAGGALEPTEQSARSSPDTPNGASTAVKSPRPPPLDDWDLYVAASIVKYKFNLEQIEKARTLLNRCKERRDAYVRSKAGQRRMLEGWLSYSQGGGAARRDQARTRLVALLKPVQRIFDEDLKPGVEKIATAAQKKGATTDTQSDQSQGKRTPGPP